MKIQPMRRTASGIQGTYANANHHAKVLIPLVNTLVRKIQTTGTDTWIQGHNIHVLVSKDGRRLVLRPLARKDKGYIGITVGLKLSRSHEVHLASIYAEEHDDREQFPDGLSVERLIDFICSFMEVEPDNETLSQDDHERLAQVEPSNVGLGL